MSDQRDDRGGNDSRRAGGEDERDDWDDRADAGRDSGGQGGLLGISSVAHAAEFFGGERL
jgi:hypothetical protein